MNTDHTYRVTGWPALPSKFDTLKYRRALVAMSVDGVSRQWLLHHCGLQRRELRSLLAELRKAELLDVSSAHRLSTDGLLAALCRFGSRPVTLQGFGPATRAASPDMTRWPATSPDPSAYRFK